MQLKRVGPFSAFKIGGAIYGIMGLIFGAFFSLFSIIGAGIAGASGEAPEGAIAGMIFGIGAVIIFPLFYGFFGGVFAALSAFLYNLIASWLGGLEVELE